MRYIFVQYIVLYESHHSLADIQPIEHMMWDGVNLDARVTLSTIISIHIF